MFYTFRGFLHNNTNKNKQTFHQFQFEDHDEAVVDVLLSEDLLTVGGVVYYCW